MRPIGLWLWYINKTIAILDIIYGPVFHFKHMIIMFVSHREHVTSPLKAQQVNEVYIGSWRRYIIITITILDIICLPVFYLKHTMDNVQVVEAHRRVSCEVRTSSTYKTSKALPITGRRGL
jgi:hypothetical protein